MQRTRAIRLGLVVCLGVVTLIAGLGLALPLSQPATWTLNLPPLAAVSEARAVAATVKTPPELARARSENRRTLLQKPLDASAWLRLAWIADQESQEAEMLDALDRSYVAAPHGPEVTEWRLRFAFDRWARLTPELRRQAREELVVAQVTRPQMTGRVRDLVRDPAGRLAINLTPSPTVNSRSPGT
ncbi:hypothetical protein [Brevundimonas bacteroides]|uniref:hypothetical protein n=1 Tax=Brevundimonas bacteroides TaxID=74311 RepID=UPI000496565D|nr:hypothetical protein [Brevundimonas bacteroides]